MSDDTATDASHATEHPPYLAHHFDTPDQQFQTGKQGMWLFLATEILLFGGLFCAYAVYRGNHPEIFLAGSRYLDANLGALNTVILICSSFTMAWAVRNAQRSERKALIVNLALTLVFACGFLGVKAVEYEHKWKHGLLPGEHYAHEPHAEDGDGHETAGGSADHGEEPAATQAAATAPANATATGPGGLPRSVIATPPPGPSGLAADASEKESRHPQQDPHNIRTFFSIYFAMTGLHGLHVLAGMAVIVWLLVRSVKGHFSAEYFTPVDLGGLYWHLVDLIWIFLFPLLYLI